MKLWFLYLVGSVLICVSCGQESLQPPVPPTDPAVFSITVIEDEVNGVPVVVAGSRGHEFMVSYQPRTTTGEAIHLVAVQDSLPVIMRSQDGTLWDIFGIAVSGPRFGDTLELLHSFNGYWFAFGAMFPGLEIYDGEIRDVQIDSEPADGWLIPTDHVFQSAGFNTIPALDFPQTISTNFSESFEFYVDDGDLVIGVPGPDHHRAYPHNLLDWHEVANDQLGTQEYAVTYCPLTGTATVWDRQTHDGTRMFGVSGLLYNRNLVPYDRDTESLWSQINELCVNGPLIGERPRRLRFVETTWRTWLYMYQSADVISGETGFDRDYSVYPYGDYKTDDSFIGLPVAYEDDRLPAKERVHCIVVDGKAKAYRLMSF
ncbi:MAG: DUF3179 domain-containing (seleno)protein [Saprospiraceae bacterium]|nr:DUF3179 domain-containing (seleno)protein [Saprospiraceae bacterium]